MLLTDTERNLLGRQAAPQSWIPVDISCPPNAHPKDPETGGFFGDNATSCLAKTRSRASNAPDSRYQICQRWSLDAFNATAVPQFAGAATAKKKSKTSRREIEAESRHFVCSQPFTHFGNTSTRLDSLAAALRPSHNALHHCNSG